MKMTRGKDILSMTKEEYDTVCSFCEGMLDIYGRDPEMSLADTLEDIMDGRMSFEFENFEIVIE